MLFSEKQTAVKRNVFHEQTGGEFTTATKQLINRSRRLLAKETRWRQLRTVLQPAFDTVGEYTTGTATFTDNSDSVTLSGANIITQGIHVGQRIHSTASGAATTVFEIEAITGENSVTLNKKYSGTTTTGTYKIFGQERYTLPVYLSEIAFIWHEDFGSPYVLERIDERRLYFEGFNLDFQDTPDAYYLVDPFGVERQPTRTNTISIVSSNNSSTDTSSAGVKVVLFGLVSGVPDREELTLNGTTTVTSSKSFSFIHRVVKTKTTTGRVTITDSDSKTLAVLPAGDAMSEPLYERIGLWPIPDSIIPVNVWGYRVPLDLVEDNDISELGQDFDQAEILLASMVGLYEERQKEEGDKFALLYVNELQKLRSRNTDVLDGLPTFLRRGESSYSSRRNAFLHPRLMYRQLGSKYGPSS